MATISWHVANLERETDDGFVFTAHWTVNATEEDDGEQFTAGAYGSIGFERPDNLIPYDNLSEAMVVQWIKEKLGEEQVEATEAALLTQIAEQKAPSKAAGLPWG